MTEDLNVAGTRVNGDVAKVRRRKAAEMLARMSDYVLIGRVREDGDLVCLHSVHDINLATSSQRSVFLHTLAMTLPDKAARANIGGSLWAAKGTSDTGACSALPSSQGSASPTSGGTQPSQASTSKDESPRSSTERPSA